MTRTAREVQSQSSGRYALTWFKIAVRNLYKNGRRSLFTIMAIGFGFAAINVFGGFTTYIFSSMQEGYIYAQALGHLTIFKAGFLSKGKVNPAGYLLSAAEVQTIQELLRGFPEVMLATGQLSISGLLSNGQVSTVFIGRGSVPSHVRTIQRRATGMVGRLQLFTGKQLEDEVEYGIGVSPGLAQQLLLDLDSNAIAVAPTVDGQLNALDVQVFQLLEAPLEILNDMFIVVPLPLAQSLYDTSSVDRLTLLLQDHRQTAAFKNTLTHALASHGLAVEVKTWRELSSIYDKVKNMFDVIFLFIFFIVSVIAIMSVINTIRMAILERVREIGTLRALGVKRQGIIGLFAIESTLLALLGSGLGLLLTLASWLIVRIIEPMWTPPQVSQAIPLEVHLVPEYMLLSILCLVCLSLGTALVPARKAAHLDIVEALGHV